MYLDYAEDQANRHNPLNMTQWADKLDAFLAFNDRSVLQNAGKVQKKVADRLALEQFGQYDAYRGQIEAKEKSDFDKFVEKTKQLKKLDESGDKHE